MSLLWSRDRGSPPLTKTEEANRINRYVCVSILEPLGVILCFMNTKGYYK